MKNKYANVWCNIFLFFFTFFMTPTKKNTYMNRILIKLVTLNVTNINWLCSNGFQKNKLVPIKKLVVTLLAKPIPRHADARMNTMTNQTFCLRRKLAMFYLT